MNQPSRSVRLTGTEEPAPQPRILRAGRLSAELDNGNLRAIRYGGVEIIRAVSFIVRDRNWGTYNATIRDLEVEENENGFAVRYRASAGDDTQTFDYAAEISGSSNALTFHAKGAAEGDFVTNRTGFVVLHPVVGVAGEPVTIEHVDGSIEKGRFPALIDPLQPMMDLRALTHEAADGLAVTCRMEGDTFEMEDQRNWTDASYKTYVRPLALPWPYTLKSGETIEQTVTLTVEGEIFEAGSPSGDRPVHLTLKNEQGLAPRFGIGLAASEIGATRSAIGLLAQLKPDFLVFHHDPREGVDESLGAAADIAQRIGAEAWLDVVVTDVEKFAAELGFLGRQVASIGSPFAVVRVTPSADLKGTLPGSPWPPSPALDALYEAARTAFPKARIGGGMFSFFTEFNRKRPPLVGLDLVGFTTSALVHAGDDRTIFESLEALPYVAMSAKAIAQDKPVVAGPSAIGMRMNPYGEAPKANPRNIRQAMNRNDPRQRGLAAAAFATGYYAVMAEAGIAAVALGDTTGAHGVVHAAHDWPQPHFDEAPGVFPIYHIERALARFCGKRIVEVVASDIGRVRAVAVHNGKDVELLVANVTPDRQTVVLPAGRATASILDAQGFTDAAQDTTFLDRLQPAPSGEIALDAYAVARILLAPTSPA